MTLFLLYLLTIKIKYWIPSINHSKYDLSVNKTPNENKSIKKTTKNLLQKKKSHLHSEAVYSFFLHYEAVPATETVFGWKDSTCPLKSVTSDLVFS